MSGKFHFLPEGSIFGFEFLEFLRKTRIWKWRLCCQVGSTTKKKNNVVIAFARYGFFCPHNFLFIQSTETFDIQINPKFHTCVMSVSAIASSPTKYM